MKIAAPVKISLVSLLIQASSVDIHRRTGVQRGDLEIHEIIV
jgi:hypothetical protein